MTVARCAGERVAVTKKGPRMNIQAVDRAMDIYDALSGNPGSPGIRAKLSRHLDQLYANGEKDHHRLTVHGLSFLRDDDRQRNC